MKTHSFRLLVVLGLLLSIAPLTMDTANAQAFGSQAFERTWARTDFPVAGGQVNRTWMWGPSNNHVPAFHEEYVDAPGGTRLVQYTDKSRMEDNSYNTTAAPWDVTNGLLARELITGRMQLGDAVYDQRHSANIQIAGDSHPNSPTYATFNSVLGHQPVPAGTTITQTIDQQGNVGSNGALAQFGVTAQRHVPETNHTVASVFWTFMNSSGLVYENGQYRQSSLFENPFFATGFPITEAHWMHVPVGGEWRDVLAQCFERRCLTYTPGNPDGWQVEAGNIGQHYYQWRYESQSPGGPVTPPPPPPPPPSGPNQAEIQYIEDVLIVLEATEISLEVFIWLMENPTFTDAWFEDLATVLAVWWVLYPELESLNPPPAYEAFHYALLEAYWVLNLAADDFYMAFTTFDVYWLEEGFAKLELFDSLLEQAVIYLPQQMPADTGFLEAGGIELMPEIDLDTLRAMDWEALFAGR